MMRETVNGSKFNNDLPGDDLASCYRRFCGLPFLFSRLDISLGPSAISIEKPLNIPTIIQELQLPFPFNTLLSPSDIKRHMQDLLQQANKETKHVVNNGGENESITREIYHVIWKELNDHKELIAKDYEYVKKLLSTLQLVYPDNSKA
ncbi:hypothetical protein L1987_39515 [Smallanthus sonchifolius]|uniref:Uncharacterized protein n=1 Tax=Smallanthus sonchifolius TaxID=185202 RepID=A0ACB9HM29_9ASTR|nr:hypothetical protein L1987_39515 [Smallanthus sonchifolius]